ncbi:MAG: nicotinamide riboside transporter PnuC [Sarcina sp.]
MSKLAIFFKKLSPFQKIFLVFFLVASVFSFFIPWIAGQSGFGGLFEVFSIIGLIASITGVIASIFQVLASPAYYLWFIVNTITYALTCLHETLYGQFILNFFILLPIEVWGYIEWKKNASKAESDKVEVRRFKLKDWVIAIGIGVVLWVVYGIFIYYLPAIFKGLFNMNIAADPSLIIDALTSVAMIMAVFITSKRFLEQWYFWIVANAGIIMFIKGIIDTGVFSMSDLSGAIVLGQFGVISIYGLFCWIKLYKEQEKKKKDNIKSEVSTSKDDKKIG